MQPIRYAVHGLLDVVIDPAVDESIRSDVDFQLNYFRQPHSAAAAARRIGIEPYERFVPDRTRDIFHLVEGSDACCHNPAQRFACRWTETGFQLFASSPSFLINQFIQLILIRHGITLVHAAAVADGQGSVTLLPGPGGVGKTALLGEMAKQQGCRLLGDDIVGVSEMGECLAFPRSFVLKHYHRSVYPEVFERMGLDKSRSRWKQIGTRIFRIARENAPCIGLTKTVARALGIYRMISAHIPPQAQVEYLAAVPVGEIFGTESILERGELNHVLLLNRYTGPSFSREPVAMDVLVNQMLATLQHEWIDGMRSFCAMGALNLFRMNDYYARTEAILRRGLARANHARLRIPANASPQELFAQFRSEQP